MTREVEVWLDAKGSELCRVGTLNNDRGQIRFRYAPDWLSRREAFALDPDLTLDAAPFFPRPDTGNFGVFLDSSPDRWGQMLMHRREALLAREEGRRARTLTGWDFLLGVQDLTRQGALRFRDPDTGTYLANERLAAPPVTSLAELEHVAHELTSRRIDDPLTLRRWLAVLVAPGASLGGARPKANFTDRDGSLWIGKFPARDDTHDQGAWELLVHRLAERAGIEVPPARAVPLSTYHTFCVQRFDRSEGRRRFYASAMTLLRRADSENASYLEIAQALQNHGDPRHLEADLRQLFRRVVFNVMVGNRDDHLRNHGFILGPDGWRLAPAFDMNAAPYTPAHVLALDDRDAQPNVATVLATHPFYRLDTGEARALLDTVAAAVDAWPVEADRLALSRAEQAMLAPAFSAHAQLRDGGIAAERARPRRGRRWPRPER